MNILTQLQELKKDSGVSIMKSVKPYIRDPSQPLKLVEPVRVANAKWKVKLRGGESSLMNPQNRRSVRKVRTLSYGSEQIINQLNTALLGAKNYPVLTTVLGITAGLASGGAGLLFTLGTTALSLNNPIQHVLARLGDEIWQVEEIGKVGSTPMFVNYAFIVDPFRFQIQTKGWLINEERYELVL